MRVMGEGRNMSRVKQQRYYSSKLTVSPRGFDFFFSNVNEDTEETFK